jgi:tRNA pseudouridine38-40 synthase
MDRAAQALLGRHDLGAFTPVRAEGSRERTIYAAGCRRDGDLVVVEIEATGFMRQMVRAIVGTLIRVGKGKLKPPDFADILRSRDRTRAGDTAPACGLYLVAVHYPADVAGFERSDSAGYPWLTDFLAGGHEEMA